MNETRPNEFGSLTARKDDKNPIESIFCHKRPYMTIKRLYKTIVKDKAKSQKATHGYEMRQEKHKAMFFLILSL